MREVEEKLERLLIRMAGKSLYLTDINWTKPKLGDSVKYGAELENSIAGRENVNGLIDKYIEYARHERSLNSSNITLLDLPASITTYRICCIRMAPEHGMRHRKSYLRI